MEEAAPRRVFIASPASFIFVVPSLGFGRNKTVSLSLPRRCAQRTPHLWAIRPGARRWPRPVQHGPAAPCWFPIIPKT